MDYPTGTTVFDHTRGHVCNCIGCCKRCGQCRTAPWHPATCDKIADLRRQERAVINRARGLP